jgi:hypothetical protein
MPQVQAPTTIIAINACNDPTETGVTDRTLGTADEFGDQLKGLYFDLTTSEAAAQSDTAIGTLYEGRYRRVQVDSGATASNVKTGTIGLMTSLAAVIADGDATGKPTVNIVTSYDQAIGNSAGGVRPVVFLNPITPGNFGYVQELGLATVLCKSVLSNTSAVGNILVSVATGVVDDGGQSTNVTYTLLKTVVGAALDLPVGGGKCRVLLSNTNFTVQQE